MKKINYLQILKSAWKVTWKNKYLWWFGLFILFSSGGTFFSGKFEEGDFQQASDFFASHQQIVLAVGGTCLLVWIAFIILGIISKGSLIKSIQKQILRKVFGMEKNIFGRYFLSVFWQRYSLWRPRSFLSFQLGSFFPAELSFWVVLCC